VGKSGERSTREEKSLNHRDTETQRRKKKRRTEEQKKRRQKKKRSS